MIEMSKDPIRKFEILVWVIKYTAVTIIGLGIVVQLFGPEMELLAENGESELTRRIDFAFISVPILVVSWATYRRIQYEKTRRSNAETVK